MLKMTLFFAIMALIFFACLVVVTAMHPVRSSYSLAELKRRAKKSDTYVRELDRYELHDAITTLLRTVRALLLVGVVCFLILAFGWVGGMGALVAAIIYPSFARIGGIRRGSGLLYLRIEPRILAFAGRFERILGVLREPTTVAHDAPRKVDSRDELVEVIHQSKDVLTENERTLLASSLAFPERLVSEVMTPRKDIDFIKQSEFLGPLVLDELHTLGHSRLPVIAEDLDHVVGVLHLRDMLSLDIRKSTTAEKAMEPKVSYIREIDTLERALATFIRTRHHLLIVTNASRETVGLLTLEDVIENLIGRRISDKDLHENESV